MNDPERKLFSLLTKMDDFFRSVLYDDHVDDWQLAREFGELLVRIEPQEPMGYALLARAYRHLGISESAREELERCRALTPHPSEADLFLSLLEEEDKYLSQNSESKTEH